MKLSTRKGQFINAPFEEPLYETVSELGFCKTIASANETQTIAIDDLVATIWNNSPKWFFCQSMNPILSAKTVEALMTIQLLFY
jgi:2-succinyl-5-enolpyruvyl-6-hydroxy-3-cyclohexene-1-carboxylate synthase